LNHYDISYYVIIFRDIISEDDDSGQISALVTTKVPGAKTYSQIKELEETPSITAFELKPMNRELEYLYYDDEGNLLITN